MENHVICNRDSFIYLFPVLFCMPLIPFPCLISLAGTSSVMMNKVDESGHPCLVLKLGEKAFRLLPLNVILTVVFC